MFSARIRQALSPRVSQPTSLNVGTAVAALIVFLILPQVVNAAWVGTLTEALLFAYYAQSWNLCAGLTGAFSLGHAVFTGAGAFTTALLLIHFGWSPWIGMFVGAVVAAAIGWIVALISSRIGISGIYFALFTMALWTVLTALVSGWSLLGNNAGLLVPPNGGVSDAYLSYRGYYYVILVFVVICGILTYKLLRSRLGLSFLAYRDDPDAAQASGISIRRTQVISLAISAFMTAFGGAFYADYYRFISPGDVLSFSIVQYMILGTMIGGACTVAGPIIGGLVFGVLSNELRNLSFLSGGSKGDVFTTGIYAIILVLTIRFLPGGLVSVPKICRDKWPRVLNPGRTPTPAPTPAPEQASAYPTVTEQDYPASLPVPDPHERKAGEPLLIGKNLSKQIGGLRALDSLDVTISQGEILGIIGPNGAGKTTLFNCLSGFTLPTSGTAEFGGHNIVGSTPTDLSRRGLGRTFQIAKPFPAMSALDTVAVACSRYASSYSAARASAAGTLRLVDFRAPFDTLGADLSNVNRKRLEVARALAGRPRLLLLDEVCAGLSAGEVQDFVQVLRSVADRGIAILMIEHVLAAVMALADRVQVLDSGRTIAEGSAAEVMKSPVVLEAYLGRSATARRAVNLMEQS